MVSIHKSRQAFSETITVLGMEVSTAQSKPFEICIKDSIHGIQMLSNQKLKILNNIQLINLALCQSDKNLT